MYNREPTVMASPPDLRHLWNRGLRGHDSRQNWYLKLPIPKALRKEFPRTKSGNEQIAIIRSLNTGDHCAYYDDLADGKSKPIDLSGVDVSMDGVELEDREFIAAITEKREPNSSLAQVLPCMRTLGRLEKIIDPQRRAVA
jgi:Bacterial oxidoreductases, C-terminal